MTQFYVITASGGSYDDSWSRSEFITDDLVKGEAYVAKQNALRDVVAAAKTKVSEWHNTYVRENPRPVIDSGIQLPVPKWPSGVKISKEMRADRERIQLQNAIESQRCYAPMSAWGTAVIAATEEFKKATFPEEVVIGMAAGYNDTYWEIEPIEVLA